MAKADKIEVDNRLKQAVTLVVKQRMVYTEFVNYCKQEWDLARGQATVYWNRVAEYLKERNDKERDKTINEQLERYWELYDKAVEKGDLRTAKDILTDINKLKGLNEPDKKDITSGGEKINIIIDVENENGN